jgi:AcrR family transcriptional regulator
VSPAPRSPSLLSTPSAARTRVAGSHRRNARGHGAQLADEIVSGALSIIERTGSSEAVTLRAVAREIGIAAPSIYAHFPDRQSIVLSVVVRLFEELRDAIEQGERGHHEPVERLVAGCEGYVRYGLAHPARYKVLFSEQRLADAANCRPVPIGPDGRPLLEFGADSFALLVDALEACVATGASTSTDVVADGTALWTALHGAISLRTVLPEFPWPDSNEFVRKFAISLGHIPTSA